MGFVEAMAIDGRPGDRARTGRSSRSRSRVFTYDEAIERFGSDKPDLRFGMELVDLAPALVDADGRAGVGVRASSTTRSRPAAGSRRSWRPGMAGATRREIDELTERAKRFGAKGLAHLALEPGGELQGPIAKFLGDDDAARPSSSGPGAGEGDLILIVADAPAVTADVLGRLRVELGDRLGLADPNVLAYVWVHRFPMYQWDAENGRWDATHNPFSGVLPEDEALLVTASGDPTDRSPERPGRPGPRAAVRPRAQRLGAGRRLGPDPSPRPARADASGSRASRSRACARSSARSSTRSSTARRRTAGSPSGIDRWAMLLARPDEHPRGHGVPQDPVGHRPDARGAVARRTRASTRSSACGSSGSPSGTRTDLGPRREPAHRDRAPSAARGARRRVLHRVLGDLLPLVGCRRRPAWSSAASTACRSCSSRPGSSGASSARCRRGRSGSRALAGVFFGGRPPVVPLRGRRHRRRASRRCWATSRSSSSALVAWLLSEERPAPGGPDRPAGHAVRRRALISGVGGGRLRRGPAARRRPRARHGDLLRGLPAGDPAGEPRSRRPAGPVAVATIVTALVAAASGHARGRPRPGPLAARRTATCCCSA